MRTGRPRRMKAAGRFALPAAPCSLRSCLLAAGVGFKPLGNFREPPHRMRVAVLPELEGPRKITCAHKPPNVGTAVRYPEGFQSLPVNYLLFHLHLAPIGAVCRRPLAADNGYYSFVPASHSLPHLRNKVVPIINTSDPGKRAGDMI